MFGEKELDYLLNEIVNCTSKVTIKPIEFSDNVYFIGYKDKVQVIWRGKKEDWKLILKNKINK